MPQITGDFVPAFLQHLNKIGVKYTKKLVNSKDLIPTQGEFNISKIKAMLQRKNDARPILVSKDMHVLDGHHRFVADLNSHGKTLVYQVDLPILDLIAVCRAFDGVKYRDVTESKNRVVGTIKKVITERT